MADTGRCQLCLRFTWLEPVLDLGAQPLAEHDDGNRYPLEVVRCADCGLAQLTCAVPREQVFTAGHPYATGNTAALRRHFAGLARTVAALTGPGDLAVDIGANDGTMLRHLNQSWTRSDGTVIRPRVLAIEPTDQARTCEQAGIDVAREFWTAGLAARLASRHGQARVITASNVLAHAADPHDFMDGVQALLAPGGTFITENHDWAAVVNGLQVDTVYHEHLRYWTPATLGRLLEMHGFLATRTENLAVHGGSFRTWAVRAEPGLQARAGAARAQLGRLLEIASEDGRIYGIGAATRATGLIHFAGLDRWLAAVCEVPGSAKIGTAIPGTRIPVIDEKHLAGDQPPHALLLAWHLADTIVPKLRAAGYQGRIIVPLPVPRMLDD